MSIWNRILRNVGPGDYSDRAIRERDHERDMQFALDEFRRLRESGLSIEEAWHALIPEQQDLLLEAGWHP